MLIQHPHSIPDISLRHMCTIGHWASRTINIRYITIIFTLLCSPDTTPCIFCTDQPVSVKYMK